MTPPAEALSAEGMAEDDIDEAAAATPGAAPKKKKKKKHRRPAAGASPGELTPPENAEATRIILHEIAESGLVSRRLRTVQEIAAAPKTGVWLDIIGLADTELIAAAAALFGLHPLALADMINAHQRPKTEAYDSFVLMNLRACAGGMPFETEQISIVFGAGFSISVQETGDDSDRFAPVRARIKAAPQRFRDRGPGYLAYALVDAAIDGFFPTLERYETAAEALEARAIAEEDGDLVGEIHRFKREVMELRRVLVPQRDAIQALLRDDAPELTADVRTYLRDCADHAAQQLDTVEILRETAAGLMDLHLSTASQRMNEVMKVLTIISTVFLPATFITGLYGMNFDTASPWNLPELEWRFGYLWAWGLIVGASTLLFLLFNAYGWIRLPRRLRLGRRKG